MTSSVIPTEELHATAEHYMKAKKEIESVVKRLEKANHELEENWDGMTKQIFYRNYREWRELMGAFGDMLESISKEMHAIANRYEEADK